MLTRNRDLICRITVFLLLAGAVFTLKPGAVWITDNGNKYMMILNRDYMTEKSVSLPLNGTYRIYEVSKADGLQRMLCDSTDTLSLKLSPGDDVLSRIQNASDEPFTIEYQLS